MFLLRHLSIIVFVVIFKHFLLILFYAKLIDFFQYFTKFTFLKIKVNQQGLNKTL